MSKSTSTPLQRGLRILKALKGKSLHGLSNRELAKALGESEVNISRAMETLTEEGLVQRLDTGRYAPGMQLLYIAQAFSNEMAAGQARIAELNQRVLAGSNN
ncbi:helix-turn-helix domain-containing protein [Salmonella enterica]|nr:IclR family transcriptional regulator [Salmonella enterica]EBW8696385.1 IclR family transcriptional regulator [Salmonella enterica subsp. diarizonae serovar 16:z10:e,n,x,z15]EKO1025206.1 helix-turn-helix domain-containing protein [Salmonella enterica subsp. enterica]ECX7401292.1 helix-turn-helix domain-containing protein [Salmonella enterica]EEP5092510.1 helix-turn-helix domain-containing protein [Salmonella enterica]